MSDDEKINHADAEDFRRRSWSVSIENSVFPLHFEGEIAGDEPVMPLKAHGEIWHTGWDIPTRWAVDAAGRAYMDNAHGHELRRVEPDHLINSTESLSDRQTVRKALGRAVCKPCAHCGGRGYTEED